MISSSSAPHSVSSSLTLNSSASNSSADRSLTGSASGATSGGGATSGSSATSNGVPFYFNYRNAHPNFNPTKPVVTISRNLESTIRAKGKEGVKSSKNRKKQSSLKEDLGKGQYSSHPSPYNDYAQSYHGYGCYPEESEIDESEATINHQKQVSSSRFMRNNYLLNEVFSDKVMPDVRQTVSNTRVETLRRQAESLIQHQERSISELNAMEEQFNERKRRMLEASEEFNRHMEKLSKPVCDEETFQALFDRALLQIKEQHEEAKNRSKESATPTGASKAPFQPPASQAQSVQKPPPPATLSKTNQSTSFQSNAAYTASPPYMPHPNQSNAGALSQTAAPPASRPPGQPLPPPPQHQPQQQPVHSSCNSNHGTSSASAPVYGDQGQHQVLSGSAAGGKVPPGQQQAQYHGNHATSFNYNHSTSNQPSHLHASQSPHPHSHHMQAPHPSHPHQYPVANSHPNHPSSYQWPYTSGSTGHSHSPQTANYHPQHSAPGMHPTHHSQQGPHPPNGTLSGKPLHAHASGQMDMNNLRNALSGPNGPGGPSHPMGPNASSQPNTYQTHNSNQPNNMAAMSGYGQRPPPGVYYPPGHHPHQSRPPGPMGQQHPGQPQHQYQHPHHGPHPNQYPLAAAAKQGPQGHPNFNPNGPGPATGPYPGAPPANTSVPLPTNALPKRKKSKSNNQNDDSTLQSKKSKKGESAGQSSELRGENNSKGKNSKNKSSEPKKASSKKKTAAERARDKELDPPVAVAPLAVDAEEDKKSDVTEVDTDNETIMSSLDDDKTMVDEESQEAQSSAGVVAERKFNSTAKSSDAKKSKSKKSANSNSASARTTANHSKSKSTNKRKVDDEDEEDEDVDSDDFDDELDDEDDEDEESEEDEDETDEDDDDDDDQAKTRRRKRTNSSSSFAKSSGGRKRANHAESRSKSTPKSRKLRGRKG